MISNLYRVIGIGLIVCIVSFATGHSIGAQPPEGPQDGIFVGTVEIRFDNFQGITDTIKSNIKFHLLQNTGDTKSENIKVHEVTTDESGLFVVENVPVNSSFAVGKVYLSETAYFAQDTFGSMAVRFCEEKSAATASFIFTVEASGNVSPSLANSDTPGNLFSSKYPKSKWLPHVAKADSTCLKHF